MHGQPGVIATYEKEEKKISRQSSAAGRWRKSVEEARRQQEEQEAEGIYARSQSTRERFASAFSSRLLVVS